MTALYVLLDLTLLSAAAAAAFFNLSAIAVIDALAWLAASAVLWICRGARAQTRTAADAEPEPVEAAEASAEQPAGSMNRAA